MAYKIVIDAGHGGADPGAVYEGRQEKDDVLRLALAVGELLEQNGVDVVYTRTEDVYDTPYEKAVIANNSGADFFVSLHRNAVPTPNTASGVETLVYRDGGIAGDVARSINSELEQLGFNNRGVIERPNLVVLKRTRMPAVLVEAGFIDNEADNAKFDTEFDSIAAGIANGIFNALGIDNTSNTVSADSSATNSTQSLDEDIYTVGENYSVYPENNGDSMEDDFISENNNPMNNGSAESNDSASNSVNRNNEINNDMYENRWQDENNSYWPDSMMNDGRTNGQQRWNNQRNWNGQQNWNGQPDWGNQQSWNNQPNWDNQLNWDNQQNWNGQSDWDNQSNWNNQPNWDNQQNWDNQSNWNGQSDWNNGNMSRSSDMANNQGRGIWGFVWPNNAFPGGNQNNQGVNQGGGMNQTGRLYRVQTGAFRVRRYAEDLVNRLRRDGFSPFVVYSDGLYRVQVGAFRQLDNAVKMEQRLRNLGYNTFISS